MSNTSVQDDLDSRRTALCGRKKVYPQTVSGTFRRIKWAADGVLPRRSTISCLRCAGTAARRARPGRADRLPEPALLLLLHRALAAGGLLLHRPADYRGSDPVPAELDRRPRLVRLSLPADRLDRSVLCGRAPDRGRPQRAHEARMPRPLDAEARRGDRAKHLDLADDRLVDRRRLDALFRRRADAGEATASPSRRR